MGGQRIPRHDEHEGTEALHVIRQVTLCGRKRTCLDWVDIKRQSFLTACRPSATVTDECRF